MWNTGHDGVQAGGAPSGGAPRRSIDQSRRVPEEQTADSIWHYSRIAGLDVESGVPYHEEYRRDCCQRPHGDANRAARHPVMPSRPCHQQAIEYERLVRVRRVQMPNDDLKQREQHNVLFLCTGNSARSIMAECLLERIGGARFRAFSAGSFPAGAVNPYALDILERRNHRTDHLRSKSWDEFAAPGAPVMDFVFTVCDQAAGEVCPVWPGQPVSAHWGFPDPAAVEGQEVVIRAAFADVYREIAARIEIFTSLPLESLDGLSLKRTLDEIGASRPTPA